MATVIGGVPGGCGANRGACVMRGPFRFRLASDRGIGCVWRTRVFRSDRSLGERTQPSSLADHLPSRRPPGTRLRAGPFRRPQREHARRSVHRITLRMISPLSGVVVMGRSARRARRCFHRPNADATIRRNSPRRIARTLRFPPLVYIGRRVTPVQVATGDGKGAASTAISSIRST